MPTRQGWTIVAGGVVSLVVGRLFGILELFVIGAGLLDRRGLRRARGPVAPARDLDRAVGASVGAHRRRHRSRRPRRAQRQPVPFTEDRPRRAGGSDQHGPDDAGATPPRRPGHRRLPHPGRTSRRAHVGTPRDRTSRPTRVGGGVDHRGGRHRRDGRPAHGRALDARARSRCARPSPDGAGAAPRAGRVPRPARLHRR